MNIRKAKKLVLKTLLAVLFATTVFASFTPMNVVYAVHTCPTGGTLEEPNKCIFPAGTDCAAKGMTSFPETRDDETVVCTKTAATQENTQAQVDRANFLLSIQRFLNKLIWPILILIGGLMDNSLLFGSGMEEHLRDIWIPIRNLVNILFVIILVGIALYNVLGIGDENSEYSIKSVLPKIIIGIIAVNFSFLGIKVFLDAVNVLTVSVFSLPGQVSDGLEQIVSDDPNDEVAKNLVDKFCRSIKGFTSTEFTGGDEILQRQIELDIYKTLAPRYLGPAFNSNMSKADIDAAIVSLGGDNKESFDRGVEQYKNAEICNGGHQLTSTGKLFLSRWNGRNAALALALNMGKIVFYEELHFNSDSIEKLAINTLFSVLLYLVYVASFVALFAVLLARLVVLWLSIAISPVLLLIMAAPSLKDKLGAFSKIEEQFVKNAIAPLLIALAMTVGWIMLKAIQGANFIDSTSSFGVSKTSGLPVVGLSTLQDLIVALGTVGVVWLGVFSAAEGTLAEFATNAMRDFLQNAGKWIGSLPFKHIPFIPVKVPGAEGEHLSTGGEVMEVMHNIFSDKPQRELLEKFDLKGASHPSDLENVSDKNGLVKYLDGVKSDSELASEKHVEGLRKWRDSNSENLAEFEKLDRDLSGALTKLLDGTDEEKRKAATTIKEHQSVRGKAGGAGSKSAKPGAAGKPAAPAGSATAELKPETPYRDGQTIKQIVDKAESDAGHTQEIADQQLNAGISLFNRHLQDLAGQLDAKKDKDTITSTLNQLKIKGQSPTQDALKTMLGTRYDALEQVMGKPDLDAAIGAGSTPPPTPPSAPDADGGTP